MKCTKEWSSFGESCSSSTSVLVLRPDHPRIPVWTNWSRYSEYVGDIFGSLLAIEATAAFFLESTFLRWAFGWRGSKKVRPDRDLLVAIASNLSALWIILANGWMQNPSATSS